MTEQNIPTTREERQARTAEVEAAANAFFDTLLTEDDALTVFSLLRSRFDLIGTVFTRTDIEDTLHSRVQGHDGERAVYDLIPALTDVVHGNYTIRRVAEEMMADAGEAALVEEADTYIMPLVDREVVPNLQLSANAEGTMMRISDFEDVSDAVEFAKNAVGRTVEAVGADADAAGLSWKPGQNIDSTAVITAGHLILEAGYRDNEDTLLPVA